MCLAQGHNVVMPMRLELATPHFLAKHSTTEPLHSHFLLSADYFQKSTLMKNSFRNTIRVSSSLDPDQARHFVGPDLGPNCL